MWGQKKNPMLDGSKPVYICYAPELHRRWKTKVVILAVVFFLLGVAVGNVTL
jgi:hypothetical protein